MDLTVHLPSGGTITARRIDPTLFEVHASSPGNDVTLLLDDRQVQALLHSARAALAGAP